MKKHTRQAMRSRLSEAIAGCALLVAACGGASGPVVTSPMTLRDTQVFDSAVDFVERPADLGGTWSQSASDDLEQRVRGADYVVLGTVRAIRSDADAAGRRTLRVVVGVDESLVGSVGDEISLPVGESEAGFDSVDGHERQLLQRRFVVCAKWAYAADRSIVARWHLSPASDPIVADVRRLVRARREATSGN